MTTRTVLARLAHYSCKFSEANVVFAKKAIGKCGNFGEYHVPASCEFGKIDCFIYKSTYFLLIKWSSLPLQNSLLLPNLLDTPKLTHAVSKTRRKQLCFFGKFEYSQELAKIWQVLVFAKLQVNGQMLIVPTATKLQW